MKTLRDILKMNNPWSKRVTTEELLDLMNDVSNNYDFELFKEEADYWVLKNIPIYKSRSLIEYQSSMILKYQKMSLSTRPPIVVAFEHNHYSVIDGEYRLTAAHRNNEKTILAYVAVPKED